MIRPRLPLLVLLLTPALPVPGPAQTADDSLFRQFDRNSDGQVTPAELPNTKTFARYDANQDGAITLAEYHQASGSTPPATPPALSQVDSLAKQLDANADGQITRAEAGGAKWFDRVDQNADDLIDADELDSLRAFMRKRGGGSAPPSPQPAVTIEQVKAVTSGPEILKPGDVGIGRRIDAASFTDLAGKTHQLSDLQGGKGLVIAMTSATCPVSKRYLPSLAQLEKDLAAQGLRLLLVNPFASETPEEIQAQLADHAFTSPYLHDRDKTLTTALQARTTTEVFLLDATRTLLYRGALDDQYGINYNLDAPKRRYLADAITAFLKHERPSIAATAAPGCELDLGDAPKLAASPVTYHRDVARILQQNCVTCHREGGIAPFALDDLAEVQDRAKVIKRVVSEATMPPWFATPAKPGEPNPWANDCSLSARDKTDLLAWLESADRPVGDVADAPAKPVFPDEWSIGKPDLIVSLSRAYDIKATGFMPYQFDVVETQLTEDKWVSGYEILPSARDVVHHVIVQVHEKGSNARDREEGVGGFWAAYVPGNGSHVYPEGFARKLPAGARISFQIHYTPSGQAKKERLRMGLLFARSTPSYEMKTLAVADRNLNIPPGADAHQESTSQRAPFDIPATSFMAHMHVRGKAFKFELIHTDGRTETLLDIPRYDFNWQLRYDAKQPRLIPRGSTLKVTALFDNSTNNKANPDPTRRVKWGNQTVDEMMIGYLEYFTPIAGGKVAAH
jgi:mono/diheme cytochrome c family protein